MKDFCVIAVTIEKSRLVSLNVVPTVSPGTPANAAIETSPIVVVDVIRPVSKIFVIVLIASSFLPATHNSQFFEQICLIFS